MRWLALLSICLFFSACSFFEKSDDTDIVEGLPTFKYLSDSLNAAGVKSVKWAVDGGEIVYSQPSSINWTLELEPIRKNNVNHLRYRANYKVLDTIVGSERRISFKAKSLDQEVQNMEVRTINGRLVYYLIEKVRTNVFSNALMRFEFTPTHYSLELNQSIEWIFESQQFVYGTILPQGELWRGEFSMSDQKTPIQFMLNLEGEKTLFVKNSNELIGFNRTSTSGDTLFFGSDYFNSSFQLVLTSDSTIDGRWLNEKSDISRSLSFQARKSIPYRFKTNSIPDYNLSGSHQAVFFDDEGKVEDTTILSLNQCKHLVTGTFLTETGDYRHLEGVIRNDSLLLSTMDGTHVYLFKAKIIGDKLDGVFYAGPTFHQRWAANLSTNHELSDPLSITTASDSIPFTFSFPNSLGDTVSLSDEAFKDKAVIISIMGTWCSNCMDEALFLKEVYDSYESRGLAIVALDFELISDSGRAFENISRHKTSLGIEYPILLASLKSTKQKASELMPALSGISSYPTMVFLDRNHQIARIHTGFSGPGTGRKNYDAFREECLSFIGTLID